MVNYKSTVRRTHIGSATKKETPDVVMIVTAGEYISENVHGHLQVYTDGSIQRKSCSATAAFTISTFNLNWNDKLVNFTSTTAVVTAIIEALDVVLQLVENKKECS